jgi:plasmid stabilization system protein ParE
MAQITLSPRFVAQLKEICQYFAEHHSVDFARQFEVKVFAALEKLEHSPQRWQRVEIPHFAGEVRRILVEAYQVFYEINGDHIAVHAIIDGRRRPPLFRPE